MAISKAERQKRKKQEALREKQIQEALARRIKPRKAKREEEIEQVVKSPSSIDSFARGHPLYYVQYHLRYSSNMAMSLNKWQQSAMIKLLYHTFDLKMMSDSDCVKSLIRIAQRHQDWLQGPDGWKPRVHNRYRQLASLLRWLFVKYEMPPFMDIVWTKDNQRKYIDWYIMIGWGESVYKILKHTHATRKMAHLFMQSPNGLTVEEALRWAQTFAYGGEQRIADAIVKSELVELDIHIPFWMELIHLFARSPMMDASQIGPVVDYVRFQKAVDEEYSLKGRTINSLIKRSEDWHQGLIRERKIKGKSWGGISLPDWQLIEGKRDRYQPERSINHKQTKYTIVQVLSGKELAEEGRAMRHCVYSYAYSCERGTSSIWSLRKNSWENARNCRITRRLLTIEVRNKDRVISQVRGYCNRMANIKEKNLVVKWAKERGLSIRAYGF
jgi:hypothetical protein